jgi:hypothetical protein
MNLLDSRQMADAYERLLVSVGRVAPEIGDGRLTSHWPLVGREFDHGILVVGQAVYGWIPDWTAANAQSEAGRSAFLDDTRATFSDRDDPMSWIAGHRVRIENSPFWRTAHEVTVSAEEGVETATVRANVHSVVAAEGGGGPPRISTSPMAGPSAPALRDDTPGPRTTSSAKPIDFTYLQFKGGGEAGARDLFQDVVAQIVAAVRPTAAQVEGSGGDWGVDVFVGELGEGGQIAIWQAKYFIHGIKGNQRRQIAEALETAVRKADDEGYRLLAWTLCVPCSLTPTEWRWWTRFRRDQEAALDIAIELWDETALARRVYAPEASAIRRAFWDWEESVIPLPVADLPDDSMYEEALFVAQLRRAAVPELSSAKQQFFNAELLVREVTDKALAEELTELRTRSAEVFALWENRFNARAADPKDDLRLLPGEVMLAVEQHHTAIRLRALRAGPIHTLGLVHRHVEDGRAGWCREWREVAGGYGN